MHITSILAHTVASASASTVCELTTDYIGSRLERTNGFDVPCFLRYFCLVRSFQLSFMYCFWNDSLSIKMQSCFLLFLSFLFCIHVTHKMTSRLAPSPGLAIKVAAAPAETAALDLRFVGLAVKATVMPKQNAENTLLRIGKIAR